MFRPVATVRDEILRTCDLTRPIDLETITRLVRGLTVIDSVTFVPFDVPKENPILGQFQRWAKQPSTYSSFDTHVEIRYAAHLSEPWRRLVVVKELCHALDPNESAHSATESSIDALVTAFSLITTKSLSAEATTIPLTVEILAEMCAVELLCPMPTRRELAKAGQLDPTALSERFLIPTRYCSRAFEPVYMDLVDNLMANGD